MTQLWRRVYSVLVFFIAVPLGLVFCFYPRGRARLLERYGFWNLSLPDCIWFHGASMGEMQGLAPILSRYREISGRKPILVTSTSVTGLARIGELADYTRLLPFDCEVWLLPVLTRVKPRVVVVAETEVWPNFLAVLARRGIPVIFVNARISDYSFPWYERIRFLIRPALQIAKKIFAATDISAKRLEALGVDPLQIEITGNAKYDIPPAVNTPEEAQQLRSEFFRKDFPVIILGSLRPEEEALWFTAISETRHKGRSFGVIVAPRHSEKFSYFSEALQKAGLSFNLWSERNQKWNFDNDIILLDAMGVLSKAYSFCQVVFIGGTLADYGGHNPLEAAPYAACLVAGPYISNIAQEIALLQQADALCEVRTLADVSAIIDRLCENDVSLRSCGENARRVWQQNRGASDRIVNYLQSI